MTDTERELQNQPLPAADPPPTPEEADDASANHLASAFALSIPIGIALGLIFFDNVAYGVAIGLFLGGVFSILVSDRV